MIDLDKQTENAGKVDNLLTEWGKVAKKHWGKLIIIGIAAGIYWMATTDFSEHQQPEEMEVAVQHQGHRETESGTESYTITKETYFVDDYGYRMGDTVYVDYYSDGYIEKYYTDYEEYIDDYGN
jgi:hypothetical protein